MQLINVREMDSIIQIACEDSAIQRVIHILETSADVKAFHVVGNSSALSYPKYSQSPECEQTNQEVHQSIIDAIDRISKEHADCYVESFVGGPGDYSPPNDCNCEKCISAGRSYRYQSFEISVSKEMFHYFRSIFCGSHEERQKTKTRKWGTEYTVPGKALICLYDRQGNMSIRSNKPEIRLGVYIFSHEDKSWRAVK
jgi:hypothetical protein